MGSPIQHFLQFEEKKSKKKEPKRKILYLEPGITGSDLASGQYERKIINGKLCLELKAKKTKNC